ncbi:MAG: hypothetical protein OXO49_08330 [Gammaproteobacteria bacterium]|nr:hypothetical protein [Gammaproteobacteria bacterium]MDE0251520.1 hypothetical protein [Gammaproteobacteria bacterium]MDE0403470.1 hypothetical protein [Gammaproteobacteria bacterium]MDE0645994.1 hypothetical protein [Gammaproteobacteria bacterium]
MPEYLPSSGIPFIALAIICTVGFSVAAWALVRNLSKASDRYEQAQDRLHEDETNTDKREQ